MLMGKKTQCCHDVSSRQLDSQVLYNSKENPTKLFCDF